jgi:hypothetical protein
MVTTFVAAVALAIVAAATYIGGISVKYVCIRAKRKYVYWREATEGNMTVPDIAGSGVATPPVMAP